MLAMMLLMICVSAGAQTAFAKVDAKEMEAWMNDHKETYDSLLTRFCNADSLTVPELYRLYYGYVFTDKYQALYSEDKATVEAYKTDAKAAYEAYKKEFEKNPIFLRTLYRLILLSDYLKHETEMQKYLLQFRMLVAAIRETGNATQLAPMYVINVPDEYMLIELLFGDFELQSQALNGETTAGLCDVMKCKMEEDGSINTYWFNVSLYMTAMERQLSAK